MQLLPTCERLLKEYRWNDSLQWPYQRITDRLALTARDKVLDSEEERHAPYWARLRQLPDPRTHLLDRAIRFPDLYWQVGRAQSLSFRKHGLLPKQEHTIPVTKNSEVTSESKQLVPALKLAEQVHRPQTQPFYKFFGWDQCCARMCLVVLQSGDPKDPASLRNVQFSTQSCRLIVVFLATWTPRRLLRETSRERA